MAVSAWWSATKHALLSCKPANAWASMPASHARVVAVALRARVGRRALPAGPQPTAKDTVGARLQAAYTQPRPDGQAWTARTLAEAAGCGRSSAASFLQRQRPPAAEPTP